MLSRRGDSSLDLDAAAQSPESSDIARSNLRQYSASAGLQTESAPFTTLTSAFYAQARLLRSSEIAVVDLSKHGSESTVTYQDLAGRVQALAQHLGDRRGQRIPLVATQGLESVVGILAILYCGAQFIPVDYTIQSEDHIRRIVSWSSQNVVLSTSPVADHLLSRVLPNTMAIISLHSNNFSVTNVVDAPAFNDLADPDCICYTVFTSGKGLTEVTTKPAGLTAH